MYKIIETEQSFIYNNLEIKPIVSISNDEIKEKYAIIVTPENKYMIFQNQSDNWNVMVCVFDSGFVEILRLLPEEPKDLAQLNNPEYNDLLEIWQKKELFNDDKNLDFDAFLDPAYLENLLKTIGMEKKGE